MTALPFVDFVFYLPTVAHGLVPVDRPVSVRRRLLVSPVKSVGGSGY